MRLSLFLLLVPSVALAQAPGETPPASEPVPDPGQEPNVQPPSETPAQAPTPAPVQAPAPTGPTLTHLDPTSVPDRCKPFAKEADAPSLNRKLSARISLASCLADFKLKPLVLCDCEQSVIDINNATQLPMTLLDEVYAMGDATMQILAKQAKGDLISSFVQRIQATVPAPVSGTPEAIALHDTRLDLLQPMLQPWNDEARAAYTEVDKLAKANPKLAKNPAVVAAVRSSRTKLGSQPTQTATR
jgi:hypothetical protein